MCAGARQSSKWLKEEFEAKYKGKFKAKDAAASPAPVSASSPAGEQHRKRRKVSAASFFADSEDVDEGEGEAAAPVKDELKEYLALPQIKYKSEQDAMVWWLQHQEHSSRTSR